MRMAKEKRQRNVKQGDPKRSNTAHMLALNRTAKRKQIMRTAHKLAETQHEDHKIKI